MAIPLGENDDRSGKRLQDFLNSLYKTAPTAPRVDFPMICDRWRIATNADWVWFWLFNDLTNGWQLLASSPPNEALSVPYATPGSNKFSVSEYVNATQEAIWIGNLNQWEATFEDNSYKVGFPNQLREMGCSAFECIPLLPPVFNAGGLDFSSKVKLRMAVCAHYRDPQKRIVYDNESLLTMGRASAQAVMNSYLMEQRATLLALDSLAASYLAKRKNHPLRQLREYTKELIDLVRDKLPVKYVSIFYRTHGAKKNVTLQCLGSTGLYRTADKTPVPANKLSGAVYRQGEGVTWQVFSSGKPQLSLIGSSPNPDVIHKYRDLPVDIEESTQSGIVYPISEPEAEGLAPNILGVIRCWAATANFQESPASNLDQMQILLLDCIARHVGFVLDTLTASVSRESAINTVRHDLLAPVQMIRDTVESMLPQTFPFQEDIPVHLKDLLFSTVTAFHLIPRLDPNPSELGGEIELKPTMLGGDIVARLKAMLTPFARRQSTMTIGFGDFSKIPQVKIDRVLVERAFYNLMMNAVKYGTPGSEIKVVPTLTAEGIIIGVMNEGSGVHDDEKDEIFEGTYRAPRFEKKLGQGLGLKIARAAMRLHDGDVVLSQQANPTIFSIIIPRKLIV
jgi:signal transduction histidine kinase